VANFRFSKTTLKSVWSICVYIDQLVRSRDTFVSELYMRRRNLIPKLSCWSRRDGRVHQKFLCWLLKIIVKYVYYFLTDGVDKTTLFTGFIGSLRIHWKSLNFEKKFQALESPWKQSRSLKVLKSPWIWMLHSGSLYFLAKTVAEPFGWA